MDRELVIVLDFGGQYNQLVARRVRECNVYCEVHPYTLSLDKIREMNLRVSSLQVVPTVYTERIPPDARKRYSKWVFRFWESVMDHSLCPICWAAA